MTPARPNIDRKARAKSIAVVKRIEPPWARTLNPFELARRVNEGLDRI